MPHTPIAFTDLYNRALEDTQQSTSLSNFQTSWRTTRDAALWATALNTLLSLSTLYLPVILKADTQSNYRRKVKNGSFLSLAVFGFKNRWRCKCLRVRI